MPQVSFSDTTWEVLDPASDEYVEVDVRYKFIAGSPEYIPSLDRPDLYDPGAGPEIDIEAVTLNGSPFKLAPAEEDKLIEWIAENHDD